MPDSSDWIKALRSSQERYAAVAGSLDDAAVVGPSYDSEWTVADVASHLGSGAEIFALFLEAGLSGGEGPGGDAFAPIWDRWNAKAPQDQLADSLDVNEAFVSRLEGLSGPERDAFTVGLFGLDLDLGAFLSMRLGEHSVHVWDIAVAVDPSTLVSADAVELLVDQLGRLAARSGRPDEGEDLLIATTAPDRSFALTTGPAVALDSSDGDGSEPHLTLPAESLLRLVYGRLDPEHTPPEVAGDDGHLPRLRAVFPGF